MSVFFFKQKTAYDCRISDLSSDLCSSYLQAFQYIQEFSGFVTPRITVIFLLCLFWPRATEAGTLVGAVASVLFSSIFWCHAERGGIAALNAVPFMDSMPIVFFASPALAVDSPTARPVRADSNQAAIAKSVGAPCR